MEKPIAAESKSQAVSQTRNCTTFSFQSPNKAIKFDVIDTPGLADTKGMAQDQQNVDMILEAAKNAGSLNAVLLVVNGRVPRQDLVCLLYPLSFKILKYNGFKLLLPFISS